MTLIINHLPNIGLSGTNMEALLPYREKGCKYFNIPGPDGKRMEFNQVL